MKNEELKQQLERMGRMPVPEPRKEFVDSLLSTLDLRDDIVPQPLRTAPSRRTGAGYKLAASGVVAAATLFAVGFNVVSSFNQTSQVNVQATNAVGSVRLPDGSVEELKQGVDLPPGAIISCDAGGELSVAGVVHICDTTQDLIVDQEGELSGYLVADASNEFGTETASIPTTSPTTAAVMAETSIVTTTTEAPATTAAAPTTVAPTTTTTVRPTTTTAAPTTTTTVRPTTTTAAPTTTTTAQPTTTTAPPVVVPREVSTTSTTDFVPQPITIALTVSIEDNVADLDWSGYDGDDFGSWVLLATTSTDASLPDTPVFPYNGTTTIGERLASQSVTATSVAVSPSSTFVAYKVAVLDNRGLLVALSNESIFELVELPNPTKSSTSDFD